MSRQQPFERLHLKILLSVLPLCLISGLLMIEAEASAATLKLPSNLKTIDARAFYGDQSLDVVILPEGIRTIGSKAFADSSISEINLPSSLVSIANDALPSDKLFLNVKSAKGTYAYQWAVSQGHIHTCTMSPVTQTDVPAAGAVYYVELTFKGNYAQYASYQFNINVSWMNVQDVSSLGGSLKKFRITVQENTSPSSRQGTVTFTCGQEKDTYKLVQNAAPQTTFTVSPTRQTDVPAGGGTYSLCAGGLCHR